MKLVQLIYYSSATGELATETLESILTTANDRNAKAGISGLLLFSNNHFLQVLEGPRAELNQTFFKIQADSRHERVLMLKYADIHTRDFAGWAMGWANETKVKTQIYFRYCSTSEFLPDDLTGESALALLKEMKAFAKSP